MKFIELTEAIGSGEPIVVGVDHIMRLRPRGARRVEILLSTGSSIEVIADFDQLKTELAANIRQI